MVSVFFEACDPQNILELNFLHFSSLVFLFRKNNFDIYYRYIVLLTDYIGKISLFVLFIVADIYVCTLDKYNCHYAQAGRPGRRLQTEA